MTKEEIRRIVRDELRVALQLISSGQAGDNSALISEDIATQLPGMPTLTGRPIMRPFGFMSRAPEGTISVTAQQGDHPGNKLTLGHRDKNVPSVQAGESKVYSVGGYSIYIANGAVEIGKDGSFQTAVLGEALATLVNALISAILAHTHPFTYVPGSNPPTQGETQALDNNVGDFNGLNTDTFLAKDGGGF